MNGKLHTLIIFNTSSSDVVALILQALALDQAFIFVIFFACPTCKKKEQLDPNNLNIITHLVNQITKLKQQLKKATKKLWIITPHSSLNISREINVWIYLCQAFLYAF